MESATTTTTTTTTTTLASKSNGNSSSTMSRAESTRCRSEAKLFKLLLISVSIPILLVSLEPVDCRQSSLDNSNTTGADKDATTNSSSSRTEPAMSARSASGQISSFETTLAPASEMLLSVSEFVDFTERPTFLFDGISNESNDTQPESAIAAADQAPTSANKTTSDLTKPAELSAARAPTRLEFAAAAAEASATTATTSSASTSAATAAPAANLAETRAPPGANSTRGEELADSGDAESEADSESDDASDEDEPADSDFHDSARIFTPPQNVSQYMDYIEGLVHDFRHQITDLFEPHLPKWIRTSQMVQLSSSCSYDMLRLALALRKFEPWALRMIDSSGKLPEGIFEGSFTSLGSYDECLQIAFDPSMTSAHQAGAGGGHQALQQTQGKYCLVNVAPFLPPKPPADRVERVFQEEADRRNYAQDDQFSRLSPMFYYMKFRIGVCIPSTCLDSDMEAVASALSATLRLNITIPNCRVRQAQQRLTRAELAGGLTFGSVLSAVLVATLLDCWRRKWARAGRREPAAVLLSCKARQAGLGLAHEIRWLPEPASTEREGAGDGSERCAERSWLDQHWSWRSFSLLTNYKLYFEHKSSTLASERPQAECCGAGRPAALVGAPAGTGRHQLSALAPASNRLLLVRCLDGIRVLSLCWVIVANSYLTLDPRATKRLTKTREAPKDFLFQMVVQASLAIETFFFLSGVLMSLSFARRLGPGGPPPSAASAPTAPPLPEVRVAVNGKAIGSDSGSGGRRLEPAGAGGVCAVAAAPSAANGASRRPLEAPGAISWLQFYVHRYVRVTPATMLVIALAMFAYSYGDGPLWFEATHKAHASCGENWWRHLLHVANFIDTRQMCFIHYWYIAADMQLFLFAPLLLLLLYRRRKLGYALVALVGLLSIGSVSYTTYTRNLPPTLLFYSSDPESRREFGNTIMTKPLTHALPYLVGVLLGKWLASNRQLPNERSQASSLAATLVGLLACLVALGEVFLPYKWNNSQLPTRFLAALYAGLFRLAWSLVLACLVYSCRHRRGHKCLRARPPATCCGCACLSNCRGRPRQASRNADEAASCSDSCGELAAQARPGARQSQVWCFCGAAGSLANRFLSLNIFTQLSKLSFVAYLIHLPLMSVFVAQTRGLFAFSHTLVIHLALSYLVMTFALSFVLVHIIEFPFITFEVHFFERLLGYFVAGSSSADRQQQQRQPQWRAQQRQDKEWSSRQ